MDCWLWGWHTVRAALHNPKRRIRVLYTSDDPAKVLDQAFSLPKVYANLTRRQLDNILWNQGFGAHAVHQGCILQAEYLAPPSLPAFLQAHPVSQSLRLMILDAICDPQNIGGLCRTAAAMGVDAAIVVDRVTPPLQGVIAKAASGALEHLPVLRVGNLAWALRLLDQHQVIGAALQEKGSCGLNDLAAVPRLALVIGAEGTGIRALTQQLCSMHVSLETCAHFGTLNAATAGALALYALRRPAKSSVCDKKQIEQQQ